jgi:catechol 2,3-dioxygenase
LESFRRRSQTAFYHEDPDRNRVEINIDNYGDCWNSATGAKTPIVTYVDPGKLVAARKKGASCGICMSVPRDAL